jgi:hypothetical protein
VHSFGQLANMMGCQSYEYNCGMLYEHKKDWIIFKLGFKG